MLLPKKGQLHVCWRQGDALVDSLADGVFFIIDFVTFQAAGPRFSRLGKEAKSVDFEEIFIDSEELLLFLILLFLTCTGILLCLGIAGDSPRGSPKWSRPAGLLDNLSVGELACDLLFFFFVRGVEDEGIHMHFYFGNELGLFTLEDYDFVEARRGWFFAGGQGNLLSSSMTLSYALIAVEILGIQPYRGLDLGQLAPSLDFCPCGLHPA
ncbi:hypothetical protein Taro_001320 [Colocasia esculenta]|uniref:Uncharacterized protein n=1 Tax=Colocasia esculenta TaxID=4460 RepID=A0A843TE94_COLES|nr:hypothetical protein [Colocasia esculenta]